METVAFRVDGGKDIGFGHIMRTMALANKLNNKKKIKKIFYITKENKPTVNKLKENNFEVLPIDPNLSYNEEIKEVKEIIFKENVNMLLTDSYEINQSYLIEMRKSVNKLVTIHDYAPFAFPTHIVINGNAYAKEMVYKSYYGDTKFLLGLDYLILRDEFSNLSEICVRDKTKNILVTVGGYDFRNLTPKIINSLSSIQFKKIKDKYIDKENLHIDVVIGPSFDNIDKIVKEVKKSNLDISLNFNINKISKLMINSDIAISSGGSTLYELFITKTPALVILQADNQKLIAEFMEKNEFINNLGYYNIDEKFNLKIKNFIENKDKKYKTYDNFENILNQNINRIIKEII